MTDKREGLIKLIKDDTISTQNSHLMRCHDIIHQENVYTESLKMDNSIQIIIKTNFHKNQRLSHGCSRNTLRLLLLTANITCFSEARYLSWGQMLKRFMTCNISSSLLWYHNKVGARTWQWNWVYRFRVFIGVNCLSKWIKMKTTYRYISNHDSFQWNWNYGKFQLRQFYRFWYID